MIRAHVGRRHARPAPAPARKSFRKILADALFWSISASLIAGIGYWSAVRWVDALTTTYVPIVTTQTHHFVFTD